MASRFAAIFWVVAGLVVLARAGYERSPVSPDLARWGSWALFGLLAIGTALNLASRSRVERMIQTPVAAILAVLCLIVALR